MSEGGADVLVPAANNASEVDNKTGPEVDAEIAAVTNGVAELQDQIKLLQQQHQMAESENQNLLAALQSERTETQEPSQQQKEPVSQNDAQQNRINELEGLLKTCTEERDNYKSQLEVAEKRVAELLASGSLNLADLAEREAVQGTLEKMTATLKEQTGQCERFERQNTQLHSQVKALKEVISVHKDLLSIRGLESDQLKTTIRLLEEHAKAEKDRRSAVLAKMEAAVRLNGELKTEYENQLRIFQDLKEKYEQKLVLLAAENKRLHDLLPVPEEEPAAAEPTEEVAEQ